MTGRLHSCKNSPTGKHQFAYDGDHVKCIYCPQTRELPRWSPDDPNQRRKGDSTR